MLWNSNDWLICFETPEDRAAICSCIYMRKVSLDHRPIFLIILCETPARCMAIAPPARRLWLPTWFAWSPKRCRPRFSTAVLIALFMSLASIVRTVACFDEKYEPMMVLLLVYFWMCFMRRITA